MDFPGRYIGPTFIGSLSLESMGTSAFIWAPSTGSATYPTANRAFYLPLLIKEPLLVSKVWWYNGSSANTGNLDVGIYSSSLARLTSLGSTAQSGGTSQVQSTSLGSSILLTPAFYYLAIACNSTSTTLFRSSYAAARCVISSGVSMQDTAFALPSTATFATFSGTDIPLFGIVASGLSV